MRNLFSRRSPIGTVQPSALVLHRNSRVLRHYSKRVMSRAPVSVVCGPGFAFGQGRPSHNA